jgi:DMSO/TMAO reductase YedYZ molybdopterin-dependent catalytic subunit
MISRRHIIAGGIGTLAATPLIASGGRLIDLGLSGGNGQRPMGPRFPGKGEMIVQRLRPPLLETPMSVFDNGTITPNDRFFVRWSGGDMPTSIDPDSFRLTLRGAVRQSVQLTLAEVARAGEVVEVTAINQCAGNSRGFSDPRVTGAQWGHGAMGNAVWRGVRLRDLLDQAGISGSAKRVRFAGLDRPLIEGAPQKIKSLPIDIARRDDVIVAWAMNGEMLPLLNGYPLRLVVPGWFATYWIKMLSDIEVLSTDEDDSYFMARSYRMPAVPVQPGDKDFPTVPITTMPPRSWITSHADDARVAAGQSLALRGIAMGGDAGVARVDVLAGGRTIAATLEAEAGPFGFRRWSATIPAAAGPVAPRCTNSNGVTQPLEQAWNPSGYARNVVEPINLVLA